MIVSYLSKTGHTLVCRRASMAGPRSTCTRTLRASSGRFPWSFANRDSWLSPLVAGFASSTLIVLVGEFTITFPQKIDCRDACATNNLIISLPTDHFRISCNLAMLGTECHVTDHATQALLRWKA